MTLYETLGEIDTQTFAQNVEWFTNDLRVYHRSKRILCNLGTSGSATIQITFNSGSNWADLATSHKFDFKDEFTFIINPDDRVNFRCSSGGGATVGHFHLYFNNM